MQNWNPQNHAPSLKTFAFTQNSESPFKNSVVPNEFHRAEHFRQKRRRSRSPSPERPTKRPRVSVPDKPSSSRRKSLGKENQARVENPIPASEITNLSLTFHAKLQLTAGNSIAPSSTSNSPFQEAATSHPKSLTTDSSPNTAIPSPESSTKTAVADPGKTENSSISEWIDVSEPDSKVPSKNNQLDLSLPIHVLLHQIPPWMKQWVKMKKPHVLTWDELGRLRAGQLDHHFGSRNERIAFCSLLCFFNRTQSIFSLNTEKRASSVRKRVTMFRKHLIRLGCTPAEPPQPTQKKPRSKRPSSSSTETKPPLAQKPVIAPGQHKAPPTETKALPTNPLKSPPAEPKVLKIEDTIDAEEKSSELMTGRWCVTTYVMHFNGMPWRELTSLSRKQLEDNGFKGDFRKFLNTLSQIGGGWLLVPDLCGLTVGLSKLHIFVDATPHSLGIWVNGAWDHFKLRWSPTLSSKKLRRPDINDAEVLVIEVLAYLLIFRGYSHGHIVVNSDNSTAIAAYNQQAGARKSPIIPLSVSRTRAALQNAHLTMKVRYVQTRGNFADTISRGEPGNGALKISDNYPLPPRSIASLTR